MHTGPFEPAHRLCFSFRMFYGLSSANPKYLLLKTSRITENVPHDALSGMLSLEQYLVPLVKNSGTYINIFSKQQRSDKCMGNITTSSRGARKIHNEVTRFARSPVLNAPNTPQYTHTYMQRAWSQEEPAAAFASSPRTTQGVRSSSFFPLPYFSTACFKRLMRSA